MDLRAAPVMAALRLALLHAILPASRLGTGPGRRTTLRVASGHVRPSVRHAVPRAQPMARLRGCVPDGPRVHPAPGRRRARSRPGTPRGGPAESRRRRGDGLRRPDRPDRVRRPPRRPQRLRPDRADAPDPADPGSAADAPEPRAPGGRLSRDVVGPRPGGGRSAAPRRSRRRVAARAVGGPGDLDGGGPRGGRTRVRPRWPGRLAGRRRSGGDRGDGPRRGLGGLPAARRTPGRPGRRCAGRRRADLARGPVAAGVADAGQRRARAAAGRSRRPGRGPVAQPVRAAGGVRRQAVLGGRDGPGGDRGRGRDAPRPGRAGPLRAAARRDPGRARPVRAAPAVRDGDAAAGERGSGGEWRHEPDERAERDGSRRP